MDEVVVKLTAQQVSQLTDLVFARLSQLRKKTELNLSEQRLKTIRDRIRVLGSFTNSLNADIEAGGVSEYRLSFYSHDRRLLKDELVSMYGLVFPSDTTHAFDADIEDVLQDLGQWVHRTSNGSIEPEVFFQDPYANSVRVEDAE